MRRSLSLRPFHAFNLTLNMLEACMLGRHILKGWTANHLILRWLVHVGRLSPPTSGVGPVGPAFARRGGVRTGPRPC